MVYRFAVCFYFWRDIEAYTTLIRYIYAQIYKIKFQKSKES